MMHGDRPLPDPVSPELPGRTVLNDYKPAVCRTSAVISLLVSARTPWGSSRLVGRLLHTCQPLFRISTLTALLLLNIHLSYTGLLLNLSMLLQVSGVPILVWRRRAGRAATLLTLETAGFGIPDISSPTGRSGTSTQTASSSTCGMSQKIAN